MALYTTHMQARNAAQKQLGKDWRDLAAIEKVGDKQFSIQLKQAEAEQLHPLMPPVEEVEAEEVEQEQQEEEAAPTNEEWTAMIEAQKAQGDKVATRQQGVSTLPNGKPWYHNSTVELPTKRVWWIADAMRQKAKDEGQPMPSRKEVQEECVRQGIASGTARTQYQAWKKATLG